MSVLVRCSLCNEPIDPRDDKVAREITGWELRTRVRASGAKGGSDIVDRQPTGRLACWQCVRRLRDGVSTTQITFV